MRKISSELTRIEDVCKDRKVENTSTQPTQYKGTYLKSFLETFRGNFLLGENFINDMFQRTNDRT